MATLGADGSNMSTTHGTEILIGRPPRRPRASHVPEGTWEKYKEQIRHLYLVKNWRLEDVMTQMLSEHDFYSSKRQYTLQLKKWVFFKNGPNAINVHAPRQTLTSPEAQWPLSFSNDNPDAGQSYLMPEDEISSEVRVAVHPSSDLCSGSVKESTHPETIDEIITLYEKPTIVPEGTSGSDSSSSCSGNGSSPAETILMTIPSRCTSVDADRDAEVFLPPSSRDEDMTGGQKAGSSADGLSSIPSTTQTTQDTSDHMDISMSDPEEPPIIMISNRPISITEFQPTFYVQSPVLRKTSPMIFLQNAALLERTLRPTPRDDLVQIERLGEVLRGSGSCEDAFRLFRVFLMQTMAQSTEKAPFFPLMLRGLVSLIRNASTPENRNEVLQILKSLVPKELHLQSDNVAQGCLLYAFLGNCLRQEGHAGLAEQYCSQALHSYRLANAENRCPSHQALIIECLALVVEERESKGWEQHLNLRVDQLRQQRWGCLDPTDVHSAMDSLLHVFTWCHKQLNDARFMSGIKTVAGTLLHKSRTSTQCANFYSTILFFLLWRRAEEKDPPSCTPGDPSPSYVDRPNSLSFLELICGTSAVESLSAITRMIIDGVESFEHSNVFAGILHSSLNLKTKGRLRTLEAFLNAHVAPLKGGDRYDSAKTSKVMETFAREFMETNFDLRLSENAFQDPRIRQDLHRCSFAPSLMSTLLSTPRSSWSRLSSNTSFSKRISQMLESNGNRDKSSSNPRWSGRSLALSMATSASSRLSARISVKRLSTIIDKAAGPTISMSKVSRYKISSPSLISTTNAQVAGYHYLYAQPNAETRDDPMDTD